MSIHKNNHRQEEGLPVSTTTGLDLEAYFQRIGYSGKRSPTLATLQQIHRLHPEAIAFENINPLLRWPVRLDMASLQEKLVLGGRGGYCYEQNLLLSHVLQALGYPVKGLAARVLWNVPEGVITARTHMLLLVEINGESFIADVGFGGLTLTAPLRLEVDHEQATPHESFRLVKVGEEFLLQAQIRHVWKPLYHFSLQEQLLPDYELASWYLSNHPTSLFINGLIAARSTVTCRYALRNNEFAVHDLSGHTERQLLTNGDQVRATLEAVFGLTLPEKPELHAALQRITQAGAKAG
jgi:N-hydroxyarylamine O-acetyltransferase